MSKKNKPKKYLIKYEDGFSVTRLLNFVALDYNDKMLNECVAYIDKGRIDMIKAAFHQVKSIQPFEDEEL